MSITNALAIDCEMVLGKNGKNLAAQVSIVNEYGHKVYNTYVFQNNVANYRSKITGLTRSHLMNGRPINEVRADVADIIRGRVLVGHSMHHDLKALGLCHPEWNQRDTAFYFRTNQGFPALKYLAKKYLGWNIQNGVHNALEDARACMRIYKAFEEDWENSLITSDSDSDSSYEYDNYDDFSMRMQNCIRNNVRINLGSQNGRK